MRHALLCHAPHTVLMWIDFDVCCLQAAGHIVMLDRTGPLTCNRADAKGSFRQELGLDDAKVAIAELLMEHSPGSERRMPFVKFEALAEPNQLVSDQAGSSGFPREPKSMQSTHSQQGSSLNWPQTHPKTDQTSLTCFLLGEERQAAQSLGETEAFQLIAEGATCGITGGAFEHLLQHAETGMMAAVLQSLAVAAGMQSHQKAQLVKMLSCQGLLLPGKNYFKVMIAYL